ncbi:phage tail protein, partial [Bacillus spizizenii]|nr:phage tail protein [Bacillus spizizenii]
MADLWVLDRYDNSLAILSSNAEEACTLIATNFREELNRGSEFSFTCDAEHKDSQHITGKNQVVFKDEDGFFRLFQIREIDGGTIDNKPVKEVKCEPAEMELLEAIVEDIRPQNRTQQYALDRVLEGTRWTGNVTAQTGTQSTNFYHISAYEAITKIIEVWGGELRFTVTFDEKSNKIIERVVNILPRRGHDEGDRFETGYNIESIHVTDMVYPVSALYGWGGSEETENGGNSRYIDFGDVVWSKAAGDPVDKPRDQMWVELPGAKEKYGYRKSDGTFINSFGQWQDENILDPKELLQKTFEYLKNTASVPQRQYELTVIPTDQVSLGDTRTAIDRKRADPIEVQSRIIALEYDITVPHIKNVEMGQFLEVYQTDKRLDEIEDKINNIDRSVTVTDGSFPDIKPPVPSNVSVHGLFSSVSLSWDFDSSSYIAAYEVYGSKVQGFTPSTSTRLWRGKEGGWVHDTAGVDNVWYYRIRSVNYHGTPSDYTAEFSALTVRIGTNHIEDQSITNAKIGNLSADKIMFGTMSGIAINAATITGSRMIFNDPDPYNKSFITASEIYMKRRSVHDNTKYSSFQVTEGMMITEGGGITGDSTKILIKEGMFSATSSYDDVELRITSSGNHTGPRMEFYRGSSPIGHFGLAGNRLSIQSITDRELSVGMRNMTLNGGNMNLSDGQNELQIGINEPLGSTPKSARISINGRIPLNIWGGSEGLSLFSTNAINGHASKNLEVDATKDLILKGGGSDGGDLTIRK